LFGEQASSDDDNCRPYDPELVTRCRLNAYYSGHKNSDDFKGDSGGEKVKNNYVCTASSLGRYEERSVDNTEQATDTHTTNTGNRAITTDQIRELINQLEKLNI
jgi:hypothetical protein